MLREKTLLLLQECKALIGERGKQYGNDSFTVAAGLVEDIFKINMSPKTVAAVLFCIKLARMSEVSHKSATSGENDLPQYGDSLRDGINYLALMESLDEKSH